jgi:hypothetical protein
VLDQLAAELREVQQLVGAPRLADLTPDLLFSASGTRSR